MSKPFAAELQTFLKKALAKNPADRFPSAEAMRTELESMRERIRLAGGEESCTAEPWDAGPPGSREPANEGAMPRATTPAQTTVRMDDLALVELASMAKELPVVSLPEASAPFEAQSSEQAPAPGERAQQTLVPTGSPPSERTGAGLGDGIRGGRLSPVLAGGFGAIVAIVLVLWLISFGAGVR